VSRRLLWLVAVAVGCEPDPTEVQRPSSPTTPEASPCDVVHEDHTVGLQRCHPGVYEAYTLFSPDQYTTTYLIDLGGEVVHQWDTDYRPGMSAYLLENGNLLRTAQDNPGDRFLAGGAGGRVQEIDWEGGIVWDFAYNSDAHFLHHDLAPLPSGNILMLAWEYIDRDTAIAAGRDPEKVDAQGVWVDGIIEVDPTNDAIVWSWSVFDHLVQDIDPSKDNYGVIADTPSRIDFNNVPAFGGPMGGLNPDWNHLNGIDYNPTLDQIVVSSAHQNELWVIDRETGEIVYRWGRPENYGAPGAAMLSNQHDPEWIEPGLPGEGHLLVFDNGVGEGRSRVLELDTPVGEDGRYARGTGEAWGPVGPSWSYEDPGAFFSSHLSSAERLANGNTLVCEGVRGRFFEVTSEGEMVWEYINPVSADGPVAQGQQGGGMGFPTNGVFRAEKYAADHPALVGRDLSPRGPIEH